MRIAGASAMVALVWGLLVAVAAAAEPDSTASISIGVAPFERRAPPDVVLPEIEQLLADRIADRGVAKIVGPGELAADAGAEPSEESVQAIADGAGVAALVVGRITGIGPAVSVDAQLRSGSTGEVLGTYVAEVLQSDQLDSAVDDLVSQVLETAGGIAPGGVPAVSAAPAEGSDGSFGISFDSDQPISIRADQLESVRTSGARKLLFTKNVVVVQDDVTIQSDRLEAFYPPDASQPERMVASGSVRLSSRENEASCDRATYERSKDSLVCRGNAELREGDDCVAGEWIAFDLESETVKVGGGAKVIIGGNGGTGRGGCR